MFLTANEAYNMSKYNAKIVAECELDEILYKITYAIEKGKFEITCDHLDKSTKKYLKELGYKVKTDEYYYETFYIVSWNKRKFF